MNPVPFLFLPTPRFFSHLHLLSPPLKNDIHHTMASLIFFPLLNFVFTTPFLNLPAFYSQIVSPPYLFIHHSPKFLLTIFLSNSIS